MNDYEILLLLDPELAEERGGEIVTRVRERVEGDKGTWDGHEPWGRRKLAYEIDHKAEGVYHLLLFTAAPETLAEVSRVLKITGRRRPASGRPPGQGRRDHRAGARRSRSRSGRGRSRAGRSSRTGTRAAPAARQHRPPRRTAGRGATGRGRSSRTRTARDSTGRGGRARSGDARRSRVRAGR